MFISDNTYQTMSVANKSLEDPGFREDVLHAWERFIAHDWGELCIEDKFLNNEALKTNDRIVAYYETCYKPIYIIKDAYSDVTTILFTDEDQSGEGEIRMLKVKVQFLDEEERKEFERRLREQYEVIENSRVMQSEYSKYKFQHFTITEKK